MRDGYIGRFGTGPVNSLELYTKLYRRYVGRRPTPDEARRLFSRFGPGYEQVGR